MNSTTCDVSVIIPTYNRDILLRQAVDSCLAVSSPACRLQVIVVDDCSTIDTRSILAGYAGEIEAVYLPVNQGHCRVRNEGLRRAGGRWVKFLDSDDTLEPGALGREVALGEESGADIVITGWGSVAVDGGGNRIAGTEQTFSPPEMAPVIDAVLAGRAVPVSAALYRRSALCGVAWDPQITKLADWDFFCQAALRSRGIARLEALSFWIRLHQGERVSRTSILVNARNFYRIIEKFEEYLLTTGQMTEPRGRRLAQYYYKELRVLCLHDRPAFDAVLRKIRELDPSFIPGGEERQPFMRLLSRMIGVRSALLLHTAVKKALKPERKRA